MRWLRFLTLSGLIARRTSGTMALLLKTFPKFTAEISRLGWGLACEAGATVLTAKLYPLGMTGVPVFFRSKRRRPRLPVLFIHGVLHNPAAFVFLKQRMAREGWSDFHEVSLFHTLRSFPSNADKISRAVDRIRREHGVEQIDIVAHSMGGILARYYIQKYEGDGKVRTLVTLGSPHQGTLWSRYSIMPRWRELSPESVTLCELNALPAPARTRAVSIMGDLDIVTRPNECGWWKHARNVRLEGIGHAGLLYSKTAARAVMDSLKAVKAP